MHAPHHHLSQLPSWWVEASILSHKACSEASVQLSGEVPYLVLRRFTPESRSQERTHLNFGLASQDDMRKGEQCSLTCIFLLESPVVVHALHLLRPSLDHIPKSVSRAVDLLAIELYYHNWIVLHELEVY